MSPELTTILMIASLLVLLAGFPLAFGVGTFGLFFGLLTSGSGYLYMIENGATTTWEHWDGERSRIHNCYNAIGAWFYQSVGGMYPLEDFPAYRKVKIEPQIPEGVDWAKTYKETRPTDRQ